MRKAEITALRLRGDFGGAFGCKGSCDKQKSKLNEQMGNSEAIVSDAKDAIRNTFAKMANALPGCEGSKDDVGNWKKLKCCFN